MITNLYHYFTDSEEFWKEVGVMLEGQFGHELFNKYFSKHLESYDESYDEKYDESDTLQRRIKWWMVVVDRGGPIPNNVYDYTFDELCMFYREATDTEMQEMVQALRDRQTIPKNE